MVLIINSQIKNMGVSYGHFFERRLPEMGKDVGRLMDQFESKME
jgi:hypothetical protein